MYKKAFVLALLVLCVSMPLSAQDANPDIDDWDDFRSDLYMKGDQTFILSLGTTFPIAFFNDGTMVNMNFSPPVGGSGSLSYNYYLNSRMFLGGELGGAFISSVNGDTLFIIPLGVRFGYQFFVWKLEIPVNAALGVSWQRFLSSGYFGIYAKLGASVYYRATTNWSFGLTTDMYWIPEWPSDSSMNMDGIIMGLVLSARYHF